MYKKLIIFLITISFISSTIQDKGPKFITSLDIENGKELFEQCSRGTPKDRMKSKIKNYWIVGDSEIKTLKSNFYKVKELDTLGYRTIGKLNESAYQLIGFENKGKKYIYINAFKFSGDSPENYEYTKDWETKPIMFCDGGDSFWGVVFDVENQKFEQLEFNGI